MVVIAALLYIAALSVSDPTVKDIEVAPNDQWMAVTTGTENIYVYSTDGTLLRTLRRGKGSRLTDVEISPDGATLACANISGIGDTCPVWSTKTWKETAELGVWVHKNYCDSPGSIDYSSGGRYVAGPTALSHTLTVWDVKTGAIAYIAKRHRSGVFFATAADPYRTLLVTRESGVDGLWFWDYQNPDNEARWGRDISGLKFRSMRQVKFSHDGNRLLVITEPRSSTCVFDVYRPDHGKAKVALSAEIDGFDPRDCAWSPDDRLIWAGGLNGQVICFDVSAGRMRMHWKAHGGAPIHAVASFPRGHRVVTGAKDICIWDGDNGKLLQQIPLKQAK